MTSAYAITLLRVWSADERTFNNIVAKINLGGLRPIVCQGCGFIGRHQSEFVPREEAWKCPECQSEDTVVADPDCLNEAFDKHYPWTRCEHCGYYFLFDDDISKLVEPDGSKWEPGTRGCPKCKRLTS